jgi:hypothetical protein
MLPIRPYRGSSEEYPLSEKSWPERRDSPPFLGAARGERFREKRVTFLIINEHMEESRAFPASPPPRAPETVMAGGSSLGAC